MLTARVRFARMLSPRVRELTIAPPPGFAFEPGQWVVLGATEAGARPYSIASPPRADGGFEVAVTRVPGSATTDALFALAPGDAVVLSRAQGDFVAGTARRPRLYVATGTGVAPVRSMLLASPRDTARPRSALLLGVRNEREVLYDGDFRALARDGALAAYWPVLSEADGAWAGRRGLVQQHLADAVRALGGDCDVFACGHGAMVRAVRRAARHEVGLADDRVRSEGYD